MNARIFLILYLIASLTNVGAHVLGFFQIALYAKVLLMPLLIAYVYESTKGEVTLLILLLCGSLIFSWGGDVALIYEGDLYFLLGMGLFLVAQALYAYLFRKSIQLTLQWKWWYVIPVLLATAVLLSQVLPNAGTFRVPIAVYALAISIMAIMAIARHEKVAQDSFLWVLVGALSFVVSDSAIAWSQFVSPFPYADAFIMLTYTAAQVMIVRGVLLQKWAPTVR